MKNFYFAVLLSFGLFPLSLTWGQTPEEACGGKDQDSKSQVALIDAMKYVMNQLYKLPKSKWTKDNLGIDRLPLTEEEKTDLLKQLIL